MEFPVTQGAYNLLEERWLPVLYGNGKNDRVGICQALTDAHKIRQIAASNPMDRVALLRFLLAVLMWCKEDAKSSLAELAEKNVGIPENWLAKLKKNKDAFNLLGDGKRFYQDEWLKGKESRPIGDLLVEFPGADSVNHIRHVVHDGSYGYCPSCCVMGILRLSVWAPANRFYPASVNPGSAAYAFFQGKNLFQMLRANLPETNLQADRAPWLDDEPPNSPGPVAKLAWRPRRIWLNVADSGGHCAYCGQNGTLVKNLCIEKGWPTPVTVGQQFGKNVLVEFQKLNDEYKSKAMERRKLANKVVSVASVILKCRMQALLQADSHAAQPPEVESEAMMLARVFEQLYADDNQKIIKELTRKPTKEENLLLDQQETQLKKFWVEDPHLLKEAEAIRLPDLSEDVGLHASKFRRVALRLRGTKALAIGIVGDGQYVFHDTPTVLLPDAAAAKLARSTMECSNELCGLVKGTTSNSSRNHPEINAATTLLIPDAEARIFAALENPERLTDDKQFLRDIYQPVVEQVIAATATGSPLHLRAAKQRAQALLNMKINDIVEKANQPGEASTADVPVKSR